MVNDTGHLPSRLTREAAHWHAMQRAGGLDVAQQARFMDWLVTSPAHLREYLAMGRLAGELRDVMRGLPAEATCSVVPRSKPSLPDNVVALPRRRTPARVEATRPLRRRLPRIAVAAVLMACIGLTAQLSWPRSGHYVASHGAPRSFELPDRTVVHLNAESELSIRFSLLQRRVELTRGQASFVVAAERRPFAVHAAGLQVQDIGTTFDVSLRREQARVDVAEGRVRVRSEAGSGRLLADLRAGQSARIDYRDHATRVSQEDAATMTAWWQRRVVFRDEPLRDVADQFNRLNTVHLHVADAAAGALRLTGNLRGDDLASLRAFLDQQPSLRTTMAPGSITVASRPVERKNARR